MCVLDTLRSATPAERAEIVRRLSLAAIASGLGPFQADAVAGDLSHWSRTVPALLPDEVVREAGGAPAGDGAPCGAVAAAVVTVLGLLEDACRLVAGATPGVDREARARPHALLGPNLPR